MAYEKYIKKDGKIYGPYLYHSKRIDGKVVSEYHGQKKTNLRKIIWILPLIFLILLGAYFIGQMPSKLTGHAVLDLNANYQEGKTLDGGLKLSLKQGELIPASSVAVFENTGKKYEYPLKDLISEPSTNGDFFISRENIDGSGEGFGISGTREIYPEVRFTLIISSEKNVEEAPAETPEATNETIQTETISTETIQETTPAEATTETQTEETSQGEQSSNPLDIISNFFLSLTPTGNAIVEFQKEVQGSASVGNPFTYTLQDGERAEIKPLSVMAGSKQLSEDDLSLTTEGNIASVSTTYSEREEGFGSSYSGEDIKEFTINLNELNLLLEKGQLKVGIFYEGEEIVSLETIVGDNEVVGESEIIPQATPEQNQTGAAPQEISPGLILNETQNKTEIPIQELELTEEERSVLSNEFGNLSLEVKSAKTKNGFAIIRYELGGYWVEYSYDESLNPEELQNFMAQDRIKWLKDLAERLSSNETLEEQRNEFLGNYSI